MSVVTQRDPDIWLIYTLSEVINIEKSKIILNLKTAIAKIS